MRVCQLKISNFRGVRAAELLLPKHAVIIGDNNVGKTTVLEALDLTLGPDRLNRTPPIDEHDFFEGKYVTVLSQENGKGDGGADQAVLVAAGDAQKTGEAAPIAGQADAAVAPRIEIEVCVTDLSEEQRAKFGDYIEFWDSTSNALFVEPNPAGVDAATVSEALRVTFIGRYSPDDDDFEGRTYFTRSLVDGGNPQIFGKRDKQVCGFLYLRTLRTGSRALSLERGSLLDIILRLKEVRPRMWEETIRTLNAFSVAQDPALGLSGILESINHSLQKYVPKEWGIQPQLKVSDLTREHLRKTITAFIATGEGGHAAPFYRQGTGTINMLVLALLSQIAADKQNVIFAMEEPETAIPPYAQKRIVHEVRQLASQAIFTSHSPYVIEEFALDETVVLVRNATGELQQRGIDLPPSVKPKRYRQEFRTRFCEGLLARRVLVAEGSSETDAFPVACRRLAELNPSKYSSLEALGICTIDAGGETNIPDMAKLYRDLGKRIFALCDKQGEANLALIEAQVDVLFMHEEKGIENLILKNTTAEALKRFTGIVDWPQHLREKYPSPEDAALDALREYFGYTKASWGIADFLAQCAEDEIPEWIRGACLALRAECASSAGAAPAHAASEPNAANHTPENVGNEAHQ
ncbi:AAA family ATPase [Ralstonia sp.]|uniref:ATP-dependent nuclease n=1 Tax=Ralstonia sp. TaxID=54061 RepID=UPI0031E458D1